MKDLSPEIVLLLTFIVSFLVTYFSIPSIVSVARAKKLFDEPSRRKSHIQQIPTLGGVAIFAGITISAGSFISYSLVPSLQYILVACIIIFFIGIKDDILAIAPGKKLLGQIAAALVLIIPGDVYFSSLHGFLGICHISTFTSLFLTTFVIIVIINSFNLIDGVDGLAASVGMVTTSFFGIWFFVSGNIEYSLLSAAVFGTLLAFFRFNVFGKKNKVFMGDTGSLLIGLLMSVQVILFNEKNIGFTSAFSIKSAPAVSFAVLIIPLYDTIRVFLVRMLRGRSPFSADKNHIHHLLLKLGYSHIQTTMIIVFVNICVIALALLLQNIGIIWLMICILSIATIFSSLLEYRVRKINHVDENEKVKKKR
ncbi:MAG: undecaprenyl/decaprenyl-phosphate alpha-N-acetylglucosaminyl 1-phosphate transferase [Bacteroidales bacterium]|jgi:UDP-N-acetylmuramyl pentapeptide phosphotransferase/UDP-N-acetylglucosamine-1-phosphate transferase|nr:undecaprenyl/decaprenyl-phosphate alpha-N-acetylglucosaminyl 1-phosphate transferase [Bacteroidales bacterium]